MSDFFATNVGNVTGAAGVDRLTVTYNLDDGGVWLTDLTAITGLYDLVRHHLTTDSTTGFAEIVVGTNTIPLNGVHQSDIGAGDIYSANDFIF